jgi:hypothetical protein
MRIAGGELVERLFRSGHEFGQLGREFWAGPKSS